MDNIYVPQNVKTGNWRSLVFKIALDGKLHEENKGVNAPFTYIFVERVEVGCTVFAGTGKQYDLGTFEPGDQGVYALPSACDEIIITYTSLTGIQIAPSGGFQAAGNEQLIVAGDPPPSVEIWVADEMIFFSRNSRSGLPYFEAALPVSTYPTLNNDERQSTISFTNPVQFSITELINSVAAGGYRIAGNAMGANVPPYMGAASVPYSLLNSRYVGDPTIDPLAQPLLVRGVQRAYTDTYSVAFTRGGEPYNIGVSLVANTPKAVVTMWIPTNYIYTVRLRRFEVAIIQVDVASDLTLFLQSLDSQPTGGLANNDPAYHSSDFHTSLVECKSAPTGGAVPGSLIYSVDFARLGISGAGSTAYPPEPMHWMTLYDDHAPDGAEPITMDTSRPGLGVVVDSNINCVARFFARSTWTEHLSPP